MELRKKTAESYISCNNLGAEPISLDCVEGNLWLGNLSAASNTELLEEKKVKFLLTVNSFPLPEKIIGLSYIKIKYIKAFDTPTEDMLSYFDETFEFIEHALTEGVILVHCCHGVSRSAAVVIAYLMKKKNLMMNSAVTYVKSKRECIEPNPGFLAQLHLYEIMHCSVDRCNVQYKKFRLYITAGLFEKKIVVPDCFTDVIKADPLLSEVSGPTIYRCKKCRRVLAQDSNLIPHAPMEKCSWSECLENTKICRMNYFIEPLAWMENVISSTEGKLHCPNKLCNNKLGSFSWVIGCPCPCGAHICPGFRLIPSKVDKLTITNMSEVKS